MRAASWGLPLPLTPALPQPAQAPPSDASEQEVLVIIISPPGQVRDKAAHIRGDRGGEGLLPGQSRCLRAAAVEAGLQRWARSSGHHQRREAVTLFPGNLLVYLMR